MRLKEALKFMFYIFCMVTTFETLFIAALGLADREMIFTARELFKIPLVAFLSALPVFILVGRDTAPRTEWVIRKVAHFTITAAIVFGLLTYFSWLDKQNAFFVILLFLALYAAAYIIQEIRAKQLAAEINKRLTAFQRGENATYRDGA